MAADIDTIVVGAGVVGLATARALALAGREVVVLERNGRIGAETSARNSEVIHAGIYYAPGSLKAALCVRGKALLYDYVTKRCIGHRRIGKLMVATSAAELPKLEALRRQALANGVDDLMPLTGEEARQLEPALACAAAVLSPSTGIIDCHGLMAALEADVLAAGGSVVLNTPVERLTHEPDRPFRVGIGGGEAATVTCRTLVVAAGLGASALAGGLTFASPYRPPRTFYARGRYYTLTGRAPFGRLIYPMPTSASLGIHLTFDLAGAARFGPDATWIEAIDYGFDDRDRAAFIEAIRDYWPALPEDALAPGTTGIRPKIVGPGELAGDFRIDGPEAHGIGGLVLLFGIESPGLTSSLAIAENIALKLS